MGFIAAYLPADDETKQAAVLARAAEDLRKPAIRTDTRSEAHPAPGLDLGALSRQWKAPAMLESTASVVTRVLRRQAEAQRTDRDRRDAAAMVARREAARVDRARWQITTAIALAALVAGVVGCVAAFTG